MNQILIVIPTHSGDIAAAQALIEWIRELNGAEKAGECLLVIDASTPKPNIEALKQSARDTFARAEAIGIQAGIKKGVDASNFMFMHAARTIQDRYKTSWLWLEPDCVPTRASWLTDLESAYASSLKRYMGAFIHSTDPLLPKTHVAGCAVYPHDAHSQLKDFCVKERAWDIEAAAIMVPAATETPLIHHMWGPAKDVFPVFVEERAPDSPENHVTLDFVKREAVLFHRAKEGSLIRLLRKALNVEKARQRNLERVAPPSDAPKSWQKMNAVERRAFKASKAAQAEPVPA